MKRVFWNVDTQYDFMRIDGKLGIKGAKEIEGNLAAITNYARENNFKIINTGDWHSKDSEEFSNSPDFITTFPEHCVSGSSGAEFIEATRPREAYVVDWSAGSYDGRQLERADEVILYKDEFDVFSGNKYAGDILKKINPESAVVYGVATNVCVDFAVKGLLERKVKVIVPEDAIKGLENLPVESVLESWKNAGVKFVTTKEILEGKV